MVAAEAAGEQPEAAPGAAAASPQKETKPAKEPRKPWFWRGVWRNKSLVSSVLYAAGIVAFYTTMQGYLPAEMRVPGTEIVLGATAVMGIGIALALAVGVVYGVIEFRDTQTPSTPSPMEHAIESCISQFPMYAFVFVLTSWGWGNIDVSWFQWLVGVILFGPVVLDNIGFMAIIAQRLYLTDEAKLAK